MPMKDIRINLDIKVTKARVLMFVAKWVLGVAAIQATVLVTLIRSMH